MRLLLILQLFIAFLSSCGSDRSKHEVAHVNKKVDSIYQAPAPSFDTSEFISSINKFIPTITSIDKPFYCRIVEQPNDTICNAYIQFKNPLDSFVCLNGSTYKTYYFSTNSK